MVKSSEKLAVEENSGKIVIEFVEEFNKNNFGVGWFAIVVIADVTDVVVDVVVVVVVFSAVAVVIVICTSLTRQKSNRNNKNFAKLHLNIWMISNRLIYDKWLLMNYSIRISVFKASKR